MLGRAALIQTSTFETVSCYILETIVGSVDVFHRRDTLRKTCKENDPHHDSMLEDIIKHIGCSPKYWKVKSNFPNCSNCLHLVGIGSYENQYHKIDEVIPPCRTIEKIIKNH